MIRTAASTRPRRSRLFYLLSGIAAGIVSLSAVLFLKPVWIADFGYPSWKEPRFECQTVMEGTDEINTCRLYYLTGALRSVGRIKNGKWDGTARSYFPDGTLRHIKHYDDGEWTGTSYHYWPDGTIFQETTYHDIENRTEKIFFPSGELWQLSDHRDELPHGRQHIYNPSGTLLAAYTAVDGQFRDKDGQTLNGTRRFSYKNGRKMLELRFRDGYLHGNAAGYRSNGKLLWRSQYSGSQVNGRYYQYYPDGKLNILMVFKDNNCIHEREYGRNGRLIYWTDIPEPVDTDDEGAENNPQN